MQGPSGYEFIVRLGQVLACAIGHTSDGGILLRYFSGVLWAHSAFKAFTGLTTAARRDGR